MSFPRNVTPGQLVSQCYKRGDTAGHLHLRMAKKFKKGNPTPLTRGKEVQKRNLTLLKREYGRNTTPIMDFAKDITRRKSDANCTFNPSHILLVSFCIWTFIAKKIDFGFLFVCLFVINVFTCSHWPRPPLHAGPRTRTRMDAWYWKPAPPDTIVLILYNMRGSCNYHTSFLPVVLAAFMAAFCGRGKVRNSKNAGAPCPPIAPLRPLGLLVACVSYPMLHLKAVHAKRGPSKMAAQCQSKQEQTSICVVRLPIPLSVKYNMTWYWVLCTWMGISRRHAWLALVESWYSWACWAWGGWLACRACLGRAWYGRACRAGGGWPEAWAGALPKVHLPPTDTHPCHRRPGRAHFIFPPHQQQFLLPSFYTTMNKV